jgi:hypothetical protein
MGCLHSEFSERPKNKACNYLEVVAADDDDAADAADVLVEAQRSNTFDLLGRQGQHAACMCALLVSIHIDSCSLFVLAPLSEV